MAAATQTIENEFFFTGDYIVHNPFLVLRLVYWRSAEFGRILLHIDIRYASQCVYMIFSSIYMGSIPFDYCLLLYDCLFVDISANENRSYAAMFIRMGELGAITLHNI